MVTSTPLPPGGGAAALQVEPGKEKSMTWKALVPQAQPCLAGPDLLLRFLCRFGERGVSALTPICGQQCGRATDQECPCRDRASGRLGVSGTPAARQQDRRLAARRPSRAWLATSAAVRHRIRCRCRARMRRIGGYNVIGLELRCLHRTRRNRTLAEFCGWDAVETAVALDCAVCSLALPSLAARRDTTSCNHRKSYDRDAPFS